MCNVSNSWDKDRKEKRKWQAVADKNPESHSANVCICSIRNEKTKQPFPDRKAAFSASQNSLFLQKEESCFGKPRCFPTFVSAIGRHPPAAKHKTDAMTKELIAIFIGGGTGSVLRYCVQMALHERIVPYNFPWATFTVNIVGSFLIGLFYAWSARFNLPTEIRLLLTTGLCGGFTTFSTFSNDGLTLLKQGYGSLFLLYVLLSIVLGILAALGGNLCGR